MKIMICEGNEDKAKVLADLLNVYQFKLVKVSQGAVDYNIEFGNVDNVVFALVLSSVEISVATNIQGTPDPGVGKFFVFTGSQLKFIENIQVDNPNAVDAKVFVVLCGE